MSTSAVRDLIRGTLDAAARRGNIESGAYERAVASAPDEDLAQVAKLDDRQLRKWVDAPERLRPMLLKEWGSKSSFAERVRARNDSLDQEFKRLQDEYRRPVPFWWTPILDWFKRRRTH